MSIFRRFLTLVPALCILSASAFADPPSPAEPVSEAAPDLVNPPQAGVFTLKKAQATIGGSEQGFSTGVSAEVHAPLLDGKGDFIGRLELSAGLPILRIKGDVEVPITLVTVSKADHTFEVKIDPKAGFQVSIPRSGDANHSYLLVSPEVAAKYTFSSGPVYVTVQGSVAPLAGGVGSDGDGVAPALGMTFKAEASVEVEIDPKNHLAVAGNVGSFESYLRTMNTTNPMGGGEITYKHTFSNGLEVYGGPVFNIKKWDVLGPSTSAANTDPGVSVFAGAYAGVGW